MVSVPAHFLTEVGKFDCGYLTGSSSVLCGYQLAKLFVPPFY